MKKRIQKINKPLFVYKNALLKREFSFEGLKENLLIVLCVIPLTILLYFINVIIYCLSVV